MGIPLIVGFFTALVLLTVLSYPLARMVRLPPPALQIMLGYAVAYLVTQGLNLDTGLRAGSFHDLVFFVFLPIVLFHAACELRFNSFMKDLGSILGLAFLGLLLTTGLCALLVYYGIGHPSGFPWVAALLTGALLSATDPAAAVIELKRHGGPARLIRVLEGESLFNDALAIVLFSSAVTLALMPDDGIDLTSASLQFGLNFFAGIASGGLGGLACRAALSKMANPLARTAASLATVYGVYLVTELVFGASGALAALAMGLILGPLYRSEETPTDKDPDVRTGEFWGLLNYLANGALFLLMGATITIAMFQQRWLAMLIAISATLIARCLIVVGTFAVLRPFSGAPLNMREQSTLIWGGTRGAVTLALALSLPASLDYWWTIQSMAYGVVIFGLLIQAPTLRLLSPTRARGSDGVK